MKNLRTFLETVRRDRPREFVDVSRSVNPKFETTAILTKLEQACRHPVLFFHSVRGSEYPVVTNVCGSSARLALAMGCGTAELATLYASRILRPLKPIVVDHAPVQERVFQGQNADLRRLPQFVYHENDSVDPYITGAIVVARDPLTERFNLSYHRLMIKDRSATSIFIARHSHLDQIYSRYVADGKSMPLAAFIGCHPMWSLGALYSGPAEIEEFDIIGALLQEPLEVIRCVSNELWVPAEAEFVLEGVVSPQAKVSEGPFGEFTGYSTGISECPQFEVHAITSRNEPIYQDIVSGHTEHMLLPVLDMEYRLFQAAREVAPSTTKVRVPLPLTAIVAIGNHEPDEPGRIIRALAESNIYIKQVVVVDDDVDVSDIRQLATAIALHVRPDRDILILRGKQGTELDPATEPSCGMTSKIGIDATKVRGGRPVVKNTVPQHILDSVDLSEFLGPVVRAEAGLRR